MTTKRAKVIVTKTLATMIFFLIGLLLIAFSGLTLVGLDEPTNTMAYVGIAGMYSTVLLVMLAQWWANKTQDKDGSA